MGPGTPETSLAELATKETPVNCNHKGTVGINTKDVRAMYVPAIPYGYGKIYKRKKKKTK